jgi:hypothetical protein
MSVEERRQLEWWLDPPGNQSDRQTEEAPRTWTARAAGGCQAVADGCLVLTGWLGFASLAGIFAATGLALLLRVPLPLAHPAPFLGGAMAAGIGVMLFLLWWEPPWGRRRRLREAARKTAWLGVVHQDLENGIVEVLDAEVRDAVRVEGPEYDENTSYFLDAGEGQLVFVGYDTVWDLLEQQGVELDDPGAREILPLRHVRIARAPRSGINFAVEFSGEWVPPLRVRKWFDRDEYKPLTGHVLAASLNTLEPDLRRLREERKDEVRPPYEE